MKKPPRTLGISLAIITGIFLFSCLPLTQAVILISLNARTQMDFLPSEAAGQTAPIIVGASVLEQENTPLILQGLLAVSFFLVSVATWRGKPPFIRFVFLGMVIVLTAGNLAQAYTLLSGQPPTPQTGMDSGADLARTFTLSQLCISLVIPSYIVWYMSRGPARAFFRGHYLPDPGSTSP